MIGDRYKDFLKQTINERHVFMQGGRRSGKTWTTFQWLQTLCGLLCDQEIIVLTYQHPQLQNTMKDFKRCTGYTISYSDQDGYNAITKGNVKWRFVHCDDKTKAQGTDCDYLFVNEAVNFPSEKEILETFSQGVRKQIFYNFNPTKSWSYMTTRANDVNTICTTWKDNADNLTPEQIAEFEAIKERAQRTGATLRDQYQYQVYYCGNFANMVGSVFGQVETCTLAEYRSIQAQEALGMDFGFATDGDPTTLEGVKIYNNKIYVHQYIYEKGLTSDEELARRLVALGINRYTQIFADYGGMGRGRMDTLITANNGKWTGDIASGFCFANAIKTTIMDGLSQMLSLDGIVITEGSELTRREFEGYQLDENGKPHGDDHGIDSCRYAFTYLKRIQ